jgi:hypothetical protein
MRSRSDLYSSTSINIFVDLGFDMCSTLSSLLGSLLSSRIFDNDTLDSININYMSGLLQSDMGLPENSILYL